MATDAPLNPFSAFWNKLGKLAIRLMRERMHGELTITFRDGEIRGVRVNRTYTPQDIPE